MKVTVCISTYQRPNGIKRLLEGINRQIFTKCKPSYLEIIVIDNDVLGHAYNFCQEIRSSFKWELKSFIEPKRGLSYVRNKSVSCVSADMDFIAFIDDDEVPEPCWLDELLYAQQCYDADVVAGPVFPHFNHSVPYWIEQGSFFAGVQLPTGTPINWASTNNVLVRAQLLKKMDIVFDERWALAGGEDWHLFQRLYYAGHKIIWASEALVYEWIPESRTTEKWLLQRSYRTGNTESLCEIDLNPFLKVRMMFIFKGIRRIILGILRLPLSWIKGKANFIKTLQYIYHSVGILIGVNGVIYEEYHKVHEA